MNQELKRTSKFSFPESSLVLKLFYVFLVLSGITLVILNYSETKAKYSDDCLVCHEDKGLTMDKNGRKISLYVNPSEYKKSTHGSMDCKDCHEGYKPDDLPHNPKSKGVSCGNCHDMKSKDNWVHKKVKCEDCHSTHSIQPKKDFGKNKDFCFKCHKSKNVLSFNQSKHSRTEKVNCQACHKGGHETIKITKSESSKNCAQCHRQANMEVLNSVHKMSFGKGTPICIDCHGAHNATGNKLTIESQSCVKCHFNEKLFPGEGKGSALYVKQYEKSVHGVMVKNGKQAAGCSDCHGDHMIGDTKKPEVKTKLLETCGKCHANEVDHFNKSAHGLAFKNGDPNAPTCTSCHGEHSINQVSMSEEFSKLNQTEMCLNCHKDNKVTKNKNTHLNDYKNSFHYIALKNGNYKAATCSDCHGPHEMKVASDPESQINKKNVDKTCGQTDCHVKQKEDYSGSIHHVSLMNNNNFDSPTCNTCHGAHQVTSPDSLGNVQGSKQKGIVQLCSSCHASVSLIANNNLPNVTGNYNESFHGLAVRSGSKQAASCGSCHGNHNIRPSADSLSTIHKNNLNATCGKCHPGATEVFINTKIHILDPEKENPLLFWITRFYVLIIIATIGGMFLHNLLDLRKKLSLKKTKK